MWPYPRCSVLPDERIAALVGLTDLRIGRRFDHVTDPDGDNDFWIQSIWRLRVLPTFDADAFLAVVTSADPWQPWANPRPRVWGWAERLRAGWPRRPTITWRRAVLSLQGETTVIDLPWDPVVRPLRRVDLSEAYEFASLDGIGYKLDIETWNLRATLSFGNPEVRSLRRLERAFVAVGRHFARAVPHGPVAEYMKVWTRYTT